MKEKSRNLPIVQFLDKLQEEYIVAEIRSKIYPKPKDKEYWKSRVMPIKREKIIDIAEKNHLPHIFTNKDLYRNFWHMIIGEGGLPNFSYKDEVQRLELEDKDKLNYFRIGTDIRVVDADWSTPLIGTIRSVDWELDQVQILSGSRSLTFGFNDIVRIL